MVRLVWRLHPTVAALLRIGLSSPTSNDRKRDQEHADRAERTEERPQYDERRSIRRRNRRRRSLVRRANRLRHRLQRARVRVSTIRRIRQVVFARRIFRLERVVSVLDRFDRRAPNRSSRPFSSDRRRRVHHQNQTLREIPRSTLHTHRLIERRAHRSFRRDDQATNPSDRVRVRVRVRAQRSQMYLPRVRNPLLSHHPRLDRGAKVRIDRISERQRPVHVLGPRDRGINPRRRLARAADRRRAPRASRRRLVPELHLESTVRRRPASRPRARDRRFVARRPIDDVRASTTTHDANPSRSPLECRD